MKQFITKLILIILMLTTVTLLAACNRSDTPQDNEQTQNPPRSEPEQLPPPSGVARTITVDGKNVATGEIISTDSGVNKEIRIDSDSVIKLDENSRVIFYGISDNNISLVLLDGAVHADIKQRNKDDEYEIRAGTSALTIREASVIIKFNNEGNPVILMLSGSGDINGDHLTEGYAATVRADSIVVEPLEAIRNLSAFVLSILGREEVIIDLSKRWISDEQLVRMIDNGEIPANVTALNLQHNSLTDVTPLAKLTNLNRLELDENNIFDITPLFRLTNLNYLTMHGNYVQQTTIDRLMAYFSSLRNRIESDWTLFINGLETDIHVVADPENDFYWIPLVEVALLLGGDIRYWDFDNGYAIAVFLDNLEISIYMDNNFTLTSGREFNGVAYMPFETLTRINNIYYNVYNDNKQLLLGDEPLSVIDFSFINNLPDITPAPASPPLAQADHVFSHFNGTNAELVQQIRNSEIPKNVTHLHLSGSQITDISPLSELLDLRILTLERTQIGDLSPLSGLVKLNELVIHLTSQCATPPLNDITPLSGLTNLHELRLGRNQISDITPLRAMVNLELLSISNNNVSDITTLYKLTNLKNVFLGGNSIPQNSIDNFKSAFPNVYVG